MDHWTGGGGGGGGEVRGMEVGGGGWGGRPPLGKELRGQKLGSGIGMEVGGQGCFPKMLQDI